MKELVKDMLAESGCGANSDVELWLLNWLVGHEMLGANARMVQVYGFEVALPCLTTAKVKMRLPWSRVLLRSSAAP